MVFYYLIYNNHLYYETLITLISLYSFMMKRAVCIIGLLMFNETWYFHDMLYFEKHWTAEKLLLNEQ